MSPALVMAIGVVGGIGAAARFILDGVISQLAGGGFPFGTLVVNLMGSFALGIVVGLAVSAEEYRVVGTGLLGAFTTFSTWAYESHRLREEGKLRLSLTNLLLSLLMGLAAVWAGRAVGGWL